MNLFAIFVLIFVHSPVSNVLCQKRRLESSLFRKTYIYDDTKRTFENAINFCELFGSTIVSVGSKLESEWIRANLRPSNFYWLAVQSMSYSIPTQYLNGSKLTWTDWSFGQPNGTYGCPAIVIDPLFGQWSLKSCVDKFQVVCEKRFSHYSNFYINEMLENLTSVIASNQKAMFALLYENDEKLKKLEHENASQHNSSNHNLRHLNDLTASNLRPKARSLNFDNGLSNMMNKDYCKISPECKFECSKCQLRTTTVSENLSLMCCSLHCICLSRK